jgi:hypothetical protein
MTIRPLQRTDLGGRSSGKSLMQLELQTNPGTPPDQRTAGFGKKSLSLGQRRLILQPSVILNGL